MFWFTHRERKVIEGTGRKTQQQQKIELYVLRRHDVRQ